VADISHRGSAAFEGVPQCMVPQCMPSRIFLGLLLSSLASHEASAISHCRAWRWHKDTSLSLMAQRHVFHRLVEVYLFGVWHKDTSFVVSATHHQRQRHVFLPDTISHKRLSPTKAIMTGLFTCRWRTAMRKGTACHLYTSLVSVSFHGWARGTGVEVYLCCVSHSGTFAVCRLCTHREWLVWTCLFCQDKQQERAAKETMHINLFGRSLL